MFCRNCGKEVEEGDRFCKNCGVLIGYTREENEPVQQQNAAEQAGPQAQEQSKAQEQQAGQESFVIWEQTGQQEFVSFRQEESQSCSSKNKMMTWVIVGAVAFLGLITLIILFVLSGAARRNAAPKLQEFRDQVEENLDDYSYDDFYDYDYDDDDYYDYDDEEDDDSYFYGGNKKQGGEQFF